MTMLCTPPMASTPRLSDTIPIAMSYVGQSARRVLIEMVSGVLSGTTLTREERRWANAELSLSGFRGAALALVLRKRFGQRAGALPVIASALDDRFRIAVDLFDATISWSILEHGAFEPDVVRLYRRVLSAGMSVVDVGANIGFHALHAASLVGASGHVTAIEPDPHATALLRLSASLAPLALAPIEIVEAALSDQAGSLVHSDLGNAGNGGARFTAKSRASLEPHVHGVAPVFRDVRAIRWDDEHLDTHIDFVKIDIEGHEPFAVRGMERSLARHRPLVLSEVAPSNLRDLGGMDARDYLQWFVRRGYRTALVEGDGVRAANADEVLAAAQASHHVDVLFTPTEKPDVPLMRA